jgi:long-chain acyl-CoA synthetase
MKVCTFTHTYQKLIHIFLLQSCIVAVVVPDVDVIKSWACENRIPGTLSVLCAHPEVKQLIMDDMISWGKEAGLKSFEQVCDQHIVTALHPSTDPGFFE